MYTTTITRKGQVVIPKAIRDFFNINPLHRFTVRIVEDSIVLEPVLSTNEAYGMFENKAVKPLTSEEEQTLIQKARAKKFKLV